MRFRQTPTLFVALVALTATSARAEEAPAPYSPPARIAAAKRASAAASGSSAQPQPQPAAPAAAPAREGAPSVSTPASGAPADTTAAPVGVMGVSTAQAEGAAVVQQILKDKEDLISGKRFTYDPGGRRDPFRSLLEQVSHFKGPRPKGITGMLTTEVDLQGIVKERTGNVAFLRGTDNKGYFVRVGDEVYDGRIISIDPDSGTVTFRQRIDDPRQIKPYRDIVKRLSTGTEEEAQ